MENFGQPAKEFEPQNPGSHPAQHPPNYRQPFNRNLQQNLSLQKPNYPFPKNQRNVGNFRGNNNGIRAFDNEMVNAQFYERPRRRMVNRFRNPNQVIQDTMDMQEYDYDDEYVIARKGRSSMVYDLNSMRNQKQDDGIPGCFC
jgi:hypothetical protein